MLQNYTERSKFAHRRATLLTSDSSTLVEHVDEGEKDSGSRVSIGVVNVLRTSKRVTFGVEKNLLN